IVEEAVAGLGLKLAVAPPGNPLTPKVTAAVKPPEGVMLTAYVVPAPCTMVCEAGASGETEIRHRDGIDGQRDRCRARQSSAGAGNGQRIAARWSSSTGGHRHC